jgi:cytochrome c biogenesis protein
MQAIYRFFKSVKLAVTLILIIAVLSLLSTLIPQGNEPVYYYHSYPPLLARLMVALGFHNFFKSLLFLIPCVLFFANLGVCTVDRFVGRLRRKSRRRYGPDLVHVGLLVLIAGALASTWGRWEKFFFLGKGDPAALPRGYTMKLLDYRYEQYPDGRPKDWVSTVQVERQGKPLIASYPIEVNRPLRLPRLKVYQTSFKREDTALLRDRDGELAAIHDGQYFEWQGSILFFAGIEGGKAVFERWQGQARAAVYHLSTSEPIGDFTIVELSSREMTGLKAVSDPGFIPVLIALALFAAGLALTFLQKRGDKQI